MSHVLRAGPTATFTAMLGNLPEDVGYSLAQKDNSNHRPKPIPLEANWEEDFLLRASHVLFVRKSQQLLQKPAECKIAWAFGLWLSRHPEALTIFKVTLSGWGGKGGPLKMLTTAI